MKISNVFKSALIGGLAVFTSCQKEDVEQETDQNVLTTTSATTEKIPEAIYTKLEQLGFDTLEGVEKVETLGKTGYQIWDIIVPEEVVNQPIDIAEDGDDIGKLFRSRNLVRMPNNRNRRLTLDLLLITKNMPNNALVGLRRAIANYNRLNLRFRYNLRRVDDGSGGVRRNTTTLSLRGNATFASARLPANGLPGSQINIPNGLRNRSARVFESVWTHELGHTLGLRHSDIYNRVSCRGLSGAAGALFRTRENTRRAGAIAIPGTNNSGTLTNSIMRTCFNPNNFNSELSPDDIRSLRRLYGR